MLDIWFQTVAAALGSMAFGIVYNVKRKRLLTVALGEEWAGFCIVYFSGYQAAVLSAIWEPPCLLRVIRN